MDEIARRQLQERFDFDSWKAAPHGAAEVSTGGLIEAGSDFEGWTASRVSQVKVPGARAASQSMWQEGDSVEALLRLDLIEAPSSTLAREVILELLDQFQSPHVQRLADPPAGDIAFGLSEGTAIVFARGNVAAMVRNAGRRVVPVVEFARALDGHLRRDEGGSAR